jgi:hypothetical protein
MYRDHNAQILHRSANKAEQKENNVTLGSRMKCGVRLATNVWHCDAGRLVGRSGRLWRLQRLQRLV